MAVVSLPATTLIWTLKARFSMCWATLASCPFDLPAYEIIDGDLRIFPLDIKKIVEEILLSVPVRLVLYLARQYLLQAECSAGAKGWRPNVADWVLVKQVIEPRDLTDDGKVVHCSLAGVDQI